MLLRPLHHLRRNVIAYVALFVALGGTGYAATSRPAQSAGATQLRNHSVGPVRLDPSPINGNVRAWAIVGPQGRVLAGGGKPRAHEGAIPGNYGITWGVKLARNCATIATIDSEYSQPDEQVPNLGGIVAGYAVAASPRGKLTGVTTFDPSGELTPLAFDVEVIC